MGALHSQSYSRCLSAGLTSAEPSKPSPVRRGSGRTQAWRQNAPLLDCFARQLFNSVWHFYRPLERWLGRPIWGSVETVAVAVWPACCVCTTPASFHKSRACGEGHGSSPVRRASARQETLRIGTWWPNSSNAGNESAHLRSSTWGVTAARDPI